MASDNEGCVAAVRKQEFGYVYFIESGPYYKIGKTIHPQERTEAIISSIQRNEPKLPFAPRLVAVLQTWRETMSNLESTLHECFSNDRLQGEWFKLERERVISVLTLLEDGGKNVWLLGVRWDDYGEHMPMPVSIPCPS